MRSILLACVGILAACGVSEAHSWLLSSSPAADEVVASPQSLRLTFAEKIEPKLTGASVKCADKEAARLGEPALSMDGKVAEMGLPALPKGRCGVKWHAVSVDGHRTSGEFDFTVR